MGLTGVCALVFRGERDARVPSKCYAGNAGVPPTIPTAREKTYPFELPPRGRGGTAGRTAVRPLSHAVGEGLGVS